MARDAEKTKQRLLEAAVEEFAAFGIAGARIDRVAAIAGCNKALIYTYFGSKEHLFEAVVASLLAELVDELPIDPEHLDQYAVHLFDRYAEQPHFLRLATWYRLERNDVVASSEALRAAHAGKLQAIKRAQQDEVISDEIPAAELLTLVLGLATTAAMEAPGLDLRAVTPTARKRARAALARAVTKIVQP